MSAGGKILEFDMFYSSCFHDAIMLYNINIIRIYDPKQRIYSSFMPLNYASGFVANKSLKISN